MGCSRLKGATPILSGAFVARGSIVLVCMIELTELNISVPSGSLIGIIATGVTSLISSASQSWPAGFPLPSVPGNYVLNQSLACLDAANKAAAVSQLLRLRMEGASILLVSHDEPLLEACTDEIWWLHDDALVARGDPAEVLNQYRHHVSGQIRATGDRALNPLYTGLRQGDGRATLESLTLNSSVLNSGETATITVTVRFNAPVADPVVGIMIRTRIGLNVYGTNTELENVKLGPVDENDELTITFTFACTLCPGHYTITAASHDPNGVWHDWLEDATGFAVTDTRYTAGVANLKAVTSASQTTQIPAR